MDWVKTMRESRKIVFLDIDGTLTSRFNYIPLQTRKVCPKARENGHLLYIASGRAREQIPASILDLGFDGLVSSAGARIEAGGEVIFNAFLPRTLLDRLLGYFDEGKSPYLLESSEKITASPEYFSFIEKMEENAGKRAFFQFIKKRFARIEEGFDRDRVYKLVFMENREKMGEKDFYFEEVEREFGFECEIFKNSIPFFTGRGGEITPAGVNKGTALERVRELYGIRREDTIAFGDGDNDRPLLEAAGVGIAMGNADESLKSAADYVTDHVKRGGLAKAFIKYGLV
jgi:Cof subfamily protein (haloacid dehalogenase superfamily)